MAAGIFQMRFFRPRLLIIHAYAYSQAWVTNSNYTFLVECHCIFGISSWFALISVVPPILIIPSHRESCLVVLDGTLPFPYIWRTGTGTARWVSLVNLAEDVGRFIHLMVTDLVEFIPFGFLNWNCLSKCQEKSHQSWILAVLTFLCRFVG